MDLSLIKPVDTLKVSIDHAACEGVTFVLAGPSHPVTRKAERERMEALLAQKRRPKPDAAKATVTKFLADRVLSWSGVEWKGAVLECTPENVVTLLNEEGLEFIREQLLAALGDDELLYKSNRG